jgi:phosphoglycerate dehydrogenase-like enzyme
MTSRGAGSTKGTPIAVFTTERSERHQNLALDSAPDTIRVVMLRNPDLAELTRHLSSARYLISERAGVIGEELIRNAASLELIQRIGSFTHDIDLGAASDAGIAVCRWPVAGAQQVAEHVVMQMLALARRLGEAQAIALTGSNLESRRTDENTFAYNWSEMGAGARLAGSTVGILGFGEIGAELARRLAGWGCTLLYSRRRRLPAKVESELDINYSDEESVVETSDFLVSLLPYSPETDMRIGGDVIARMKPGSYLASCGSGAVVDEQAAAEALRRKHLSGVALDTFEWEPIEPGNPLAKLAKAGFNVVLTPHIAGGDKASAAAERRGYFANIVKHQAGKPLSHRIV